MKRRASRKRKNKYIYIYNFQLAQAAPDNFAEAYGVAPNRPVATSRVKMAMSPLVGFATVM